MGEAPAPFVSADIDVRDLDGFMLNVERLLASELWALSTPEEFKAAVGLWCRAWKQLPGGSLPNDERVLAAFSGTGARWRKVRDMALRGFVLCSDGRLYHKVLCEDVIRAFTRKVERRERTRAATEARQRQRDEQRNVTRDDTAEISVEPSVTKSQGQDRTRQDAKEEVSEANASAAEVDPVMEVFDRGVAMLGASRRSLLGKFCKSHGEVAVLEALVACETERPVDPVSFFVACMSRAPPKNGHAKQSPVTNLYEGAMRAADKLDRQEADRLFGIPPARTLLDSR